MTRNWQLLVLSLVSCAVTKITTLRIASFAACMYSRCIYQLDLFIILEQTNLNSPTQFCFFHVYQMGNTALHIAATAGYQAVVKLLMEYGASPLIENKVCLMMWPFFEITSALSAKRNLFAPRFPSFDSPSEFVPVLRIIDCKIFKVSL